MCDPEQLDVDGVQPALEGLVCEEILAIQYWHAGKLEEPVNTAHLRFGGSWYRLYFDHGILFWRAEDDGPRGFEAPELGAEYRIHDIAREGGLAGLTLSRIQCVPTDRGSRVLLEFEGGRELVLTCTDDRTDYRCV